MQSSEKKITADTLTERSKWVIIGLLPILVRPLTLGQIYEMGAFVNEMDAGDLDLRKKYNATAEMLLHYKNAPLMQQVFLMCVFRRRWKRRLFGKYVLKRLTVSKFQVAMEVITNAYTTNFFLTSIIFLSQTKRMTEPKQRTVLGQSSVE